MEYPPGLLAASTPSLTRQAVFNPYDIPVSPHIRDLVVPKLTGNLNYCGSIGWFVCLPGWWNHSAAILFPLKKYHPTTTLNTFPLGISTLRCVEPYMSSTSCSGRLHEESPFLNLSDHRQAILCFPWVYYRANPNGFIRTLGAPEENLDLGVTADAGLLSRRQPHRNFDSLTQPDSHSTGYTTTQHHHPTPLPHPPAHDPGLHLLWRMFSPFCPDLPPRHRGLPPTTSTLNQTHRRPLDGHGHLWHVTYFWRPG